MLTVSTPVTIKNILVATDFSPLWKLALPIISGLAQRYGAKLTLLNVVPAAYPELSLEPTVLLVDEKKEIETVATKLQTVADEIDAPLSEKATLVRIGDTVQSIVDAVTERHVDLVVITTHGRVGLSRLVLGSTAEQILRRAPCPVLTIGPETNTVISFREMSTILVPVDFSLESNNAAQYAAGLAEQYQARVVLLHIIDRTLPPYKIDFERNLAGLEILKIRTGEVQTENIVRVGIVEEEIVQAAAEFRASCLVMGRHEHGVLSTHLPFTTLSSVLLHAPCPVFTVA